MVIQADDNELLLEAVLNGLVEVLSKLLSNGVCHCEHRRVGSFIRCACLQLGSQVEKITVLEQLEKVLITVDELVDGG